MKRALDWRPLFPGLLIMEQRRHGPAQLLADTSATSASGAHIAAPYPGFRAY
jgi:hypothetical protein